ncbi:transmembrane protein 51a [Megalops cyprinoides]|uniref:transmembrane protein 51a n=1 Tax=Megalops cyprinoides TaxID=118141 RepID=UPI001863B4EB|nr:transmembrane protein 51a [Megalops cyprinoides]
MCSSGQPGAGSGRPSPGSASDNSNNSGSQYALCALGVGLVALGIVMIVWSVVPSDAAGNSSSGGSKPGIEDTKGKTSTVAFVLVGAGVATLLLSICLGVRSKHRQQRLETEALDAQFRQRAGSAQEGETVEENTARYDVPTYEEAVGSGQYPVRQSNLRNSSSQLPSYEDLVDGLRHENEGQGEPPYPPPAPTGDPQPPPAPAAAAAAAAPPGRHNGLSLKLRPLKVRRIKSEKLHLKNPPQAGVLSIEPLTPPPQYEDKMPEL